MYMTEILSQLLLWLKSLNLRQAQRFHSSVFLEQLLQMLLKAPTSATKICPCMIMRNQVKAQR